MTAMMTCLIVGNVGFMVLDHSENLMLGSGTMGRVCMSEASRIQISAQHDGHYFKARLMRFI